MDILTEAIEIIRNQEAIERKEKALIVYAMAQNLLGYLIEIARDEKDIQSSISNVTKLFNECSKDQYEVIASDEQIAFTLLQIHLNSISATSSKINNKSDWDKFIESKFEEFIWQHCMC